MTIFSTIRIDTQNNNTVLKLKIAAYLP